LRVNKPAIATGREHYKTRQWSGEANVKQARREGIGDFIFMNAPKVPARKSGGAGMKKGSVALTP
jgi:hypothetical protein